MFNPEKCCQYDGRPRVRAKGVRFPGERGGGGSHERIEPRSNPPPPPFGSVASFTFLGGQVYYYYVRFNFHLGGRNIVWGGIAPKSPPPPRGYGPAPLRAYGPGILQSYWFLDTIIYGTVGVPTIIDTYQ